MLKPCLEESHCRGNRVEPQHKTIMTAQRRNFQRRRAAFAAVITLSSATRSAFAFTTPQPASSRGSMGGGSATRAAFVAPSHPLCIPAASSLEGLLSSAAAQSGLSSSTSLSMAGAGALAGCLTGGLFAGGLHAIAGKFSSRPSASDFLPTPLRRNQYASTKHQGCLSSAFYLFLDHFQLVRETAATGNENHAVADNK